MARLRLMIFGGVLGGLVVGVLALPAQALAQPSGSGADYGHHVAGCAQTMGFDGEHNPGMHQGRTGWDGMPC